MNLPEKEAVEVMNRITEDNPTWKLKIKEDGPSDHPKPEKFNRPSNYQQQQQPSYQPNLYHMPPQQMQPPPMMNIPPPHQVIPSLPQQSYNRMSPSYNSYTPQQPQNDKG